MAADTHPVDLEGSSDKQQARGQLSQENDTLALKAASQQNEHCAWRDAAAKLCGLLHVPPPEGLLQVICRVEPGSLQETMNKLSSRTQTATT